MDRIEMKAGGFAIYDAPPALKKFLIARESGNASKELLVQLSADAMAEQEAEPESGATLALRIIPDERGVVLDFGRSRVEREQEGSTP